MDWKLFCSVYGFIFLAELPDKTAFATLLMAAQGKPLPIFLGASIAFLIQSLIAVTCGGLLSHLPQRWVHLFAGISFFVFAIGALRRQVEEEEDGLKDNRGTDFALAMWSSFLVIFLAEWGDITQLATISLVAQYQQPLLIFVSATLALWSATGVVVLIGGRAKKVLHPVLLNRIAAGAFFLVGIYFVYGWFQN